MVVSPKILDRVSTDSLSLLEGEDAQMECRAEGKPRPKITWQKLNPRMKG